MKSLLKQFIRNQKEHEAASKKISKITATESRLKKKILAEISKRKTPEGTIHILTGNKLYEVKITDTIIINHRSIKVKELDFINLNK